MANKKEREYMSKVANLGCWICEAPANVHHIRPKGLGRTMEVPSSIIWSKLK